MSCPAGGNHEFSVTSFEEIYYPPHSGEWGGTQHGHQCCHQCKGAVDLGIFRVGDGRCHGACGGVCNIAKKRTAMASVCGKCGKIVKQ